jgi:transposase
MRYELTDYEWAAIKPFLPNKPRGVPRVNDRRVLNGIFWVLRSGAPWRDLPQNFGPYTTCYNRFVRWRRAGVWTRIMNALAATHDAAVQMIDTSIIRVHQHAACIARNKRQSMGRSRGGLTSKIHAVVDTNGLPSMSYRGQTQPRQPRARATGVHPKADSKAFRLRGSSGPFALFRMCPSDCRFSSQVTAAWNPSARRSRGTAPCRG